MSESIHIVCPHCSGVNRVPKARLGSQPRCGKCRRELFSGRPTALDEAGLKRRLKRSEVPLLVDFWAPWCAPCRSMAPAYEKAAGMLEPEVMLAKVNTEENQRLATQFGIRSIPTLILFRGQREAARVSGAMDTQRLVSWTRQNL